MDIVIVFDVNEPLLKLKFVYIYLWLTKSVSINLNFNFVIKNTSDYKQPDNLWNQLYCYLSFIFS